MCSSLTLRLLFPVLALVASGASAQVPRGAPMAVEEDGVTRDPSPGEIREVNSLRTRAVDLARRYQTYSEAAATRYSTAMDPDALEQWVEDARAAAQKIASPEVRKAINDMYRPIFYPETRYEVEDPYDEDQYYDDTWAQADDETLEFTDDESYTEDAGRPFQRWAQSARDRVGDVWPGAPWRPDGGRDPVIGEAVLDSMRLGLAGARLAAPSAASAVDDAAGVVGDVAAVAEADGSLAVGGDGNGGRPFARAYAPTLNLARRAGAFMTGGANDNDRGGIFPSSEGQPNEDLEEGNEDWSVSAVSALRATERAGAAARAMYEDNVSETQRSAARAFARRFVSEALQTTLEMQARTYNPSSRWNGRTIDVNDARFDNTRVGANNFVNNLRLARRMAVAREGNEGDAMNAMSETEEAAFERALVSELRAEKAVEAVEAHTEAHD
jgi:hypothetical protein